MAVHENSFATMYMEQCRQAHQRPLPMICVTLPHSLDFTTDRVKMDDWSPILNSLSTDRTLRSISVRSKYQHRKLLEDANSETKARAVGKAPVVLTRFLIEWLSHSLNQCVRYSTSLTSLELEGIPIPVDCLAVLCVGLSATKSLQRLSLQRCYVGDAGCELILRTVADVHNIRTLNLANCDLTSACGPAIGSALSRQKLALYHEAWKQSLRYRKPNIESMPGLKRLTLNGNTKLGNEAVTAIVDAIRDSLWFKALDLQQCGLSEDSSKSILELLDQNKALVIIDVRLNQGLRDDSLQEILRKLDRNNGHGKNEYQWLGLPNQKDTGLAGNKRVSSAGNLHQRPHSTDGKGRASSLTRPRSAMIRQVKRPPPPVVFRKPLMQPVSPVIRKIKLKPSVPAFDRNPRQPMKPPERARIPEVEPGTPPKVSLHLDLQSQIRTVSEEGDQMDRPSLAEENEMKLSSRRNPPTVDKEDYNQWPSEPETIKVEEVIRELLEMRAERDRLAEEMRRREMILAEERARREFTEAKFRSAKCDLAELEETIKQRERDSQGYLLINQKSMEEICLSFARLLDMLEDSSRLRADDDDSISRQDSEEDNVIKEDIKRRFALIIRKTKSENLKRGYFVDDQTALSRFQMTARYGRSEGNIRSARRREIEAPSPPMLPIERGRIGDTAENRAAVSRRQETRQYGQGDKLSSVGSKSSEDSLSPGDRARVIFESFMNGQSLLNPETR